MPYTEYTNLELARARRYLNGVLTGQERDLTERWVNLWDSLASDLQAAVLLVQTDGATWSRRRRVATLTRALEHVQDRVSELVTAADARLVVDVPEVVATAIDAQAAATRAGLPTAANGMVVGFDRFPTDALDAMITRTTGRIQSLTKPLTPDMVQAMKVELGKGVAIGDNPRTTAARIMRATEGRFNGGLARALTISRTEMLDAHRAAGHATDQLNTNVLDGWVWVASLSGRTCMACLSMNGTEHPVEEQGPAGHQQCRCSRAPRTKSWADLGFPGLDEPAEAVPDTGAWFDNLTVADQRNILGRRNYDAYQRGEFPITDWATTRSNPGWRDSVVPNRAT